MESAHRHRIFSIQVLLYYLPIALFVSSCSSKKADPPSLSEASIKELVLKNRLFINLPPAEVHDYSSILPLMESYNTIANPKLKGDAAYIIGHYYFYIYDSENAVKFFSQSANLYKSIGQWGLYLNTIKDYCNISRATGNNKVVEPLLRECLQISRTHDVGFYVLDPLAELTVELAFSKKKYREAIKYGLMYMDSLKKYEKLQLHDPDYQYNLTIDSKNVELELGHSYLQVGELDKAEPLLRSAQRFFVPRNSYDKIARLYKHLAVLYAKRNMQDSVISNLTEFDEYQTIQRNSRALLMLRLPRVTKEIQNLNQKFLESQKEVEELRRRNFYISIILALTTILAFVIVWAQRKSRLDQMRVNDLLVRDFERIKKLNQEKTRYFSILSHELRTPIFAITGLARLLGTPEGNTEDNIEAIVNSGNHLLHLVNNVLQHNKLENSSKIMLDETEFKLSTTLSEVIQTISYLANQKNIDLVLQNELKGPQHIFGDRQKLAQILVNLLSNAIKYSPRNGTVELSVQLISVNGNKRVYHFGVRDYGPGIDAKNIPTLFDYRKTTYDNHDSDQLKGMGIGLFVVDNFLKAMGSTIKLESKLGEGAYFYFDIPFQFSSKTPDPQAALSGTNNEIRVLVVDDNKINLIVTQKMLTAIGVKCFVATDADPVIEIIRSEKIDLILMDINMPLISGYDLSRQIYEAGFEIPVIAHTAVIKENINYDDLAAAHIHDFLVKPYTVDELKQKLSQYLKVSL